jgi:hypothetical protein
MKKEIVYLLLALTACSSPAKTDSVKQSPQTTHLQLTSAEVNVSSALLPKEQRFTVHPNTASVVKIGNGGTQLHIPKHAFADASGKTVTEDVTLVYREFKDAADMAFSGIPMDLTLNGRPYCFNSSGMFSLEGECKGQAIEIARGKSLEMDYRLARKNPGTDFYRLKADSSNWELVEEIPGIQVDSASRSAEPANNQVIAQPATPQPEFHSMDVQPVNVTWGDAAPKRPGRIQPQAEYVLPDTGDRKSSTLLAAGSGDPGHTYPDIVKGLNIGTFGVYNCDQIYRLKKRVNIRASYTDENGKAITDGHVLSLIDLNYNGAFSFQPAFFTCSATGDNILLLFTRSKKLYLLEKGAFGKAHITADGPHIFRMKDVTEKFRSASDLSAYLSKPGDREKAK